MCAYLFGCKGKFNPGQLDICIRRGSIKKVLKSLDFDYIEKPSIPNSVEESLVPESVARQRLEAEQQEEVEQQEVEQEEVEEEEEEVEQEGITAVREPVCGIQLAYQRQCSSCNEGQLAFNIKAINHRCEACGFYQKVGSNVKAATGTVWVNKGDVKLTLKLTSTVLMTYLSQNNLQELLAGVQLVEEHFFEVGKTNTLPTMWLSLSQQGMFEYRMDVINSILRSCIKIIQFCVIKKIILMSQKIVLLMKSPFY